MRKFTKFKFSNLERIKFVIFSTIFLFTFVIRASGYERIPTPNHLDEQLYAWSGLYLIETGVPVSWSTLDYPKSAEVFRGVVSYKGRDPKASVTLYKPWLDEPPLFSLIVGYSAHLFRAERSDFIPSSYIRFPMIFISALTSIFVFLIAKKVNGYWTGIMAMLVYGTVPIFVFASRTAMPETLISLFLVISVYLLMHFWERPRFVYLLAIPLLAGLGGLAKPTGYFILPLAIFLVAKRLYKGKFTPQIFRYIFFLVLSTLPFILIYIWYGNHFDPQIFKRIVDIQGFRPAGFASLMWYFITPSLDTSILRDSWYVFCLISASYFLLRPKSSLKYLVSLSFVYWVVVIMLSSGENDLLAWYRFPTFPFLAIFGTWGLQLLVKKANFFSTFFAAGMLLGARMLFVRSVNPNIQPSQYRFVFTALMFPSIANAIFKKSWLAKLSKIIIILIIMVGMYFNIKYIYNAFDIDCEGKSCPFVPVTSLSKLHLPFVWRFLKLPELHEQLKK